MAYVLLLLWTNKFFCDHFGTNLDKRHKTTFVDKIIWGNVQNLLLTEIPNYKQINTHYKEFHILCVQM